MEKPLKFCEPCRALLMEQTGFNVNPAGASALAYNIQLRDLFIMQAMIVCAPLCHKHELPAVAIELADEMMKARMKHD